MRSLPRRGCPGPVVRGMAVLGLCLGLLGCSGSHEPPRGAPPPRRHVQVAPDVDVPALIGMSIDGLRQRLGPLQPLPEQFATSAASALLFSSQGQFDSLATFRTGGLLVLANYDTRSRQVRDLLLLGHHEDSLMSRAHLRSNATAYLVMPVFRDTRSFRLLGLRVIPTK